MSPSLSSRRDFLATTSVSAAGAMLARRLGAQLLPSAVKRSPLSATTIFPAPMAPAWLQSLATTAVNAARDAGATYADIRLAERHFMSVSSIDPSKFDPGFRLESAFTYGVRALVDGAWAFAYGTSPSESAVVASARAAVTSARGFAKTATRRVDFAPAPVVTGEWETPTRLDPFTVPLEDHTAFLGACSLAANRVRHAWGSLGIDWTKETRVFASSEGSLTTQRYWRTWPWIFIGASLHVGRGVVVPVPTLVPSSGGYEVVDFPGVEDDIKRTAEEAAQLAMLPLGTMDVGRYPIVFDGLTLGATFGRTVGAALELDRVLGYEADASGTSYLSPPASMLDAPVVSPLLNVTGHRAPPSFLATKWDDDGVESRPFPLVNQGRLVDYSSTRHTATALQSYYAGHGRTPSSNGCATAYQAELPVSVASPHLTIAPGTTRASLEDLYKDMSHGLLVRMGSDVAVDHQLASGFSSDGCVFEIVKGKIVRQIFGSAFEFSTARHWKSLAALGDARTTLTAAFDSEKGQPWHRMIQSTTAPAGLFKDVNVMSTRVSLS